MSDFKTKFRIRELKLIFKNVPEKYFDNGIELGAGAGVQTIPLFHYCKRLVATEYERDRFNIPELIKKNNHIEYQICDAERIDEYFNEDKFDLVFSSNMMEHLPDPHKAFIGIFNILNENGICISTIPSPFMKLLYVILFYPAEFFPRIIRIIKKIFLLITKKKSFKKTKSAKPTYIRDNNPKYNNKVKKDVIPLFIPKPHGACDSNFKELLYWRKKVWIKMMEQRGFHVIKTIKLPVTTGYSFKLQRFCELLYRIGFCSSYGYVAVKRKNAKIIDYYK